MSSDLVLVNELCQFVGIDLDLDHRRLPWSHAHHKKLEVLSFLAGIDVGVLVAVAGIAFYNRLPTVIASGLNDFIEIRVRVRSKHMVLKQRDLESLESGHRAAALDH